MSEEIDWKQRAEAAEKERDSLASMSDVIQSKAKAIEAENVELKKARAEMRAAIASTAGHGYLSPDEVREKVKPLVDALEMCVQDLANGASGKQYDPSWIRPRTMSLGEIRTACEQAYHRAHNGLDHARKEGLI